MTYRQHFSENLRLAVPVMLSNLGHVMMGVTDNMMVGHLGPVSLAGVGLALVAFNVLLLFGIGVSYAITPLVAEGHGEKNESKIIAATRHGLAINFFNSLFLIIVVTFGSDLLYILDQEPAVVAEAIPFLRIITWSLVPVMIFQSFKQFAEGLSQTKVAMIVIIGANVINVLFNYVLIYGHLGFEPMGVEGAGWATFYSRTFMAVTIALYIYFHPSFRKYRAIFSLTGYTSGMFRKILGLGVPSGVQFIFEAAAFDFSLVMMGWFGTQTQAAHQIAINLATVSYMTTAGLAASATVRVGYFFGLRDGANMRAAFNTSLVMALGLMVFCATLFVAASRLLPALYINDAEVITIASSLLVIAGFFQIADGVQVVCASALRGIQDVKIPSVLILIAYWVIALPLGYYLAFHTGVGAVGIWWGLCIGLTLTASALYVRTRLLMEKMAVGDKAAYS